MDLQTSNNIMECSNCKNAIDFSTDHGYCPKCGYAYGISEFERESIKRRILADNSNDHYVKHLQNAGAHDNPKDWMLRQEYITASLKENTLVSFLESIFDKRSVLNVAAKYRLETHIYKEFKGASIFYQFDEKFNCHAFKVMQYNQQGKRVKYFDENDPDDEKSLLYQKPLMGAGNYCLFGRHLLAENKERPVCIVESEKSAMIAAIAYPQAIWMATGSCYYLMEQKMDFGTENVYLFPDPDVKNDYNGNWYWMAEHEPWLKGVKVSHFMEKYCKENNKETDFDIADYIVENWSGSNFKSFNDIILI